MPPKSADASLKKSSNGTRDANAGEPLDVFLGTGGALVWKSNDAMRLRMNHSIMGDFVGTMPRHRAQNQYLSIPLALSEEEVYHGHSRGILNLLHDKSTDYVHPDHSESCKFYEARDAEIEQCAARTVTSQNARRSVRDQTQTEEKPSKSKKRRRSDEQENRPSKFQKSNTGVRFFLRSIFNRVVGALSSYFPSLPRGRLDAPESNEDSAEIDNISTREVVTENTARQLKQARASASVQTTCEAQENERLELVPITTPTLNGLTGATKARSEVFERLRERGYTVSCGAKFGADYLAYAGDPSLFHGSLAVIMADHDGLMPLRELVAVGRLSDSTRKRAVWALNDGRTLGVQWEENLP